MRASFDIVLIKHVHVNISASYMSQADKFYEDSSLLADQEKLFKKKQQELKQLRVTNTNISMDIDSL
jgi:hypothetical protein